MSSCDVQGPQTERSRDTNLLSFCECESPNRGDRHDENDKVGEDRGCCVCNPGCDLIDAFAGNVRVPHLLDRHTDEEEDEGDDNDPDHHERPDRPCHLLEVWQAEDAVVHQENADLRPAKVPRVQDLCNDQPFGHPYNFRWFNEICVHAHTIHMHGENETDDDQVPSLCLVSYSPYPGIPQSLIGSSPSRTRSCSHPTIMADL